VIDSHATRVIAGMQDVERLVELSIMQKIGYPAAFTGTKCWVIHRRVAVFVHAALRFPATVAVHFTDPSPKQFSQGLPRSLWIWLAHLDPADKDGSHIERHTQPT